MPTLGLDIGGANLKAACADGRALTVPFAIWKTPDRLAEELTHLTAIWSHCETWAVTMTAELADCYATKAEGVQRILEQVQQAAKGRTVKVWSTGGEWLTLERATTNPFAVAAANWHALATWVGSHYPTEAVLLVDIGSTTSDLIPLQNGRPRTVGLTDVARLLAGELVYTGIRRTPLCAVAPAVSFQGQRCRLAAELFATTIDLYLLSGDLPEDTADCETADNRPATREAAHNRIAHQICCDTSECDVHAAQEIARQLADQQLDTLAAALKTVMARLTQPLQRIVISGSGAFLAERLVAADPNLRHLPVVNLQSLLSPETSTAACAYALAALADGASPTDSSWAKR